MTKRSIFPLRRLLLGLDRGAPRARAGAAAPHTGADPHTYTDPGMTFTAPPERVSGRSRREVSLNELGDDLQAVAMWVLTAGPGGCRVRSSSRWKPSTVRPNQWEAQFESQTHSSQDGALIKNQTPMTLLNGMPATYVEVAYGSGFDARKEYAITWADGQRGVVLAETARIGDVTADEADEALKQVKAVRYPLRPAIASSGLRGDRRADPRRLRCRLKDEEARR